LKKAMDVLQDSDTVLAFHAELDQGTVPAASTDPTHYSTFLASRPEKLEEDAISLITRLMPSYPQLRCHIVHLSASSALPLIARAKASGLRLTVETCFHYLALTADRIPVGAPEFKCCPPIRDEANRDALWAGLRDGTIDFVVSDHSPCVASLKRPAPDEPGDFMSAWGGISTLGLGLAVLWTEARHRGGVSIGQILRWTAVNTAKHASLDTTKGKIAPGYDADLVIWDPDATFTVSTLPGMSALIINMHSADR
jgi:allantoinase